MKITAPNRPTSRLRSLSIKHFLLVGLVVSAAIVVSSTSSVAGSLSQRLFASATAIVNGQATHAFEFAAAPVAPSSTMSAPRRGHTATRLSDGRVLIAGGENGSGVLNESEIYDPATATFSPAGNLTSARVDHTATLLGDGRVLIAGGRDAAALDTTEIFDPATGAFTSGPSLSVARAGHSATLFANSRVLMAGGTASGSAEILDLAAGTSAAAGTMSVARSMHAAVLLNDGKVLVAGGRDASGTELKSGEIFDGATGSFSNLEGDLLVGRVRPHLRVLFDGKVQVIGGSNDGSMEIYDPSIEKFGAYAHVVPESDPCVGLHGHVLGAQTRAALFHNGQSDPLLDRIGHTITELDGQALVLGGVNTGGEFLNTSSLVSSNSSSITADKLDYSPGDTAIISGRGFEPGETVRLKIHEDPHTPQERGFDVVADAEGNFTGEYLVTEYDLAMKFVAGARGLTSGRTAQTTFTDGVISVTIISPTSGSPATVTTLPATVNVTFNYRTNGSGGPITCTINVRTGATIVAQTNCILARANGAGGLTVTFPVTIPVGTANGSYAVDVIVVDASGTGSPASNADTENNAVIINGPVNTNLTLQPPSPASVAFGSTGPVTFTATLVRQLGGAPVSGATITFRVDGAPVGTATTNGSGVATFSTYNPSALNAGGHSVLATFAGETIGGITYVGSTSNSQTLTVNKRDTSTTVSSSLNPSTFGQSVSFTATVVGTGAGAGNPNSGLVQFKIDGANFGGPVPLAAGSATSSATSSLTAGNHTVEAIFTSTDNNFNGSNDLLDGGQTVNKRDTLTTVSSSLNPSTFGENVTFTATVVGTGAGAGNPSGGSVQFKIDGANFGAPVALVAGAASVNTSSLNAGNHTVEAFFTSADTNFNDSNDALDGGQTVNKRDTLTTVSSSLNPSTFGENVTFTATVVGTGAGAGNPSAGSVQFKIDGANFGGPVALVAGAASVNTSSLTAGNHTVEAFFTSADTNFNDSNDALDGGQTVNKRDTLTTVSSSVNPSTFGENVTFTATVVGTGAGASDPSGGSVQFKIDGANFGAAVTLVAGSASVNTSSLTSGNHTVEAFFTSADTNFNDSNDTLDGGQTVNKRDTLTTVSSSLNPSTFGQSVTFTATVVGTGAGAGNPSGGSVQFKIDGANFGAPIPLVAGSATSGATSSLTAGNHTVEAFFTSADTNFNDSNDLLDGGQTVNKRDTLTTVSSSLNPSVYGQSVTFTATVTGTGPGAGNPTGGSVQFKIDGTNVGSPVALSSGSASSAPINSITAGSHTVEAVFTSADTNFNNSSDLLDGGQTVNKAPLTITASSHTVTFNDPVPTITPSYSGFVLGEGASNLTTQPTCSTTYTVGSLVGTYPTKCENAASSNYSFTYVDGTVTVVTACSVFNGFLSPIGGAVEQGNGGSFLDPVRAFKLGSTVPVKFNAICFGVPLTAGVHTLQVIKYSNSTDSEPPIDATPTDAATTGNQFRLTGTEWHYNLNTKALGGGAQGTYLVKATLFDGSSYTVWVSLKK